MTEGVFRWVTGEPLVYTDWRPGEPNNLGGGADYVAVDTGNQNWNDLNGGRTAGSITEWDDRQAFAKSALLERGSKARVFGFNLDDFALGGRGRDTVFDSLGSHTLVGGKGGDDYVFDFASSGGDDAVRFQEKDTITITGYGLDFDTVIAGAVQQDNAVLLTLAAGQTVLLRNTMLAELCASDFVFIG